MKLMKTIFLGNYEIESITDLLLHKDDILVRWVEPRPAMNEQLEPRQFPVELRTSVATCIAMRRLRYFTTKHPMPSDARLLEEFLEINCTPIGEYTFAFIPNETDAS